MFLKNEISLRSSLSMERLNKKVLKILLAFLFSILIAVSSNIFLYLPITPIPVTVQTMTVLCAAIILGRKYVLISTGTYIVAGLLGLPVFAGFKSGISSLAGPSGGYIIGFLISSFITAIIFENLKRNKKLASVSILIACIAGISLIYLFGYMHMLLFFYKTNNYLTDANIFINIFNLAIKPFILVDIVKILIIVNSGALIRNSKNISRTK
ncbi:MAG: biotin transporter BioY [Actinomycetota bacterium]|nr:biotin transporter BioY [Actinomycetota bacterium]